MLSGGDMTDSWNAQNYQSQHAFVWEYGRGLLELLKAQPRSRILDLGCGTGQLTAQIAEQGATVLGLDASSAMIAQAKSNFPALEFAVADATTFSVAEPFDAIFSNATLHWVKPPEQAAARIFAALKPGGRLVLEMGGYGNISGIMQATQQVLQSWGLPFSHPWYFPSLGEYSHLLEQHGFRVQMAQLFPRPTRLEAGELGLENWIRQFGTAWLESVPLERHSEFFAQVADVARGKLWQEEAWFADYVRLRVVAYKP
jgi:trans-aconitate methyltransferase